MKIKDQKTAILQLHEGMKFCCYVVQNVWAKYTQEEPVVTGGQEVGHSEKSLHYGSKDRTDPRCRALDFDSPGLNSTGNWRMLRQDLQRYLGAAFQVLPCFLIKRGSIVTQWVPTYDLQEVEDALEADSESARLSHFHIELDPKW